MMTMERDGLGDRASTGGGEDTAVWLGDSPSIWGISSLSMPDPQTDGDAALGYHGEHRGAEGWHGSQDKS